VTVGYSHAAAWAAVPALLEGAARDGVRVKVIEASAVDLVEGIAGGRFDLGVARVPPVHFGVEYEALGGRSDAPRRRGASARARRARCVKRVVADANVLVSAALARSPSAPSALVLLAEVAGVLTRPRLARYLSGPEARRFVAGLASQTTLTSDAPLPHPAVCRDPDDDFGRARRARPRRSDRHR